ncbi:hypothetical protein PpBr36_08468 [Pyricularia pennisetigena]|uniref:hypothetical protein n=1 Tax=Pyricularia pennisetigena TaxID=1578925 RepID=UPI00114F0D32|nr:hypothetical protein PpBr36_08468 [Pyricularia pennisetigena]TLS24031.1 hypothetical protein PpBr36_08468 [Pyricularia pennisetigena]
MAIGDSLRDHDGQGFPRLRKRALATTRVEGLVRRYLVLGRRWGPKFHTREDDSGSNLDGHLQVSLGSHELLSLDGAAEAAFNVQGAAGEMGDGEVILQHHRGITRTTASPTWTCWRAPLASR